MLKIRFHGRGGQGAVTAVKLLGKAVFCSSKYAQNLPEFGVERRGAPVRVHLYIDNEKITARYPILVDSDCDVFFDKSLIYKFYIENQNNRPDQIGLKENALIVVNTNQSPEELVEEFEFLKGHTYKIVTVPASRIAAEHGIGSVTSPIVNTTILGSLAKVLDVVTMSTLAEVMVKEFDKKAKANIQAAQDAYKKTLVRE